MLVREGFGLSKPRSPRPILFRYVNFAANTAYAHRMIDTKLLSTGYRRPHDQAKQREQGNAQP